MTKICALPECQQPYTIGCGVCCRKSHQARYSALIQHKKINNPKIKDSSSVRASFVGPPKPRYIKYKQSYIPMCDLSLDQQNKRRARSLARHKRVKLATPKWANIKLIENLYLSSKNISDQTGIPHQVDHIIPLKHKLVCGLHVEQNLRIITKSENSKKSNLFIV
jgi:hypothetical protein